MKIQCAIQKFYEFNRDKKKIPLIPAFFYLSKSDFNGNGSYLQKVAIKVYNTFSLYTSLSAGLRICSLYPLQRNKTLPKGCRMPLNCIRC